MRIQPFSVALQVHLLPHFRQVPPHYLTELSQLSGQAISDLQQLPEKAGSKFHPAFASDPQQLYRRMVQGITENRFSIVAESRLPVVAKNLPPPAAADVKTDYALHYERELWPEGIGYDQVVPLSALDTAQQNRIRWQQRSDHLVQVLPAANLPPTWQLNCIVQCDGEVTTVFPGTWLPPLNEQITQDYVFLISDPPNSPLPDEQ